MNSTRRAKIKARTPEEFERWRKLAEKTRKKTTTYATTTEVNK